LERLLVAQRRRLIGADAVLAAPDLKIEGSRQHSPSGALPTSMKDYPA